MFQARARAIDEVLKGVVCNGYSFERVWNTLHIKVTQWVSDATVTVGIKMLQIQTGVDIVDYRQESILASIENCLKALATHEIDEQFKYEGKCVNDPHPEKKGQG